MEENIVILRGFKVELALLQNFHSMEINNGGKIPKLPILFLQAIFQRLLIMKGKQAPGGNLFDRLRSKLRYNEVNVVEAFVVSLIFFLHLMLAQTLNSQTIL